MSHITTALISASPPPRLRTFVLVSSVFGILALAFLATPFTPATQPASAQTLVDYDTDGDNLIEVSTRAQWAAINHDRDGNGVPTQSGATAWQTAFPDAMSGNGCAATCIGYELAADLDFSGQTFTPIGDIGTGEGYAGTFKGNGFQIQNATLNSGTYMAPFVQTEATAIISGLGVINPNFASTGAANVAAGIVGLHRGKLFGSYVVSHHTFNAETVGGLVGNLYFDGVIAHSYSRVNINAGSRSPGLSLGGIAGYAWGAPTCISSYSHGNIAGTSTLGLQVGAGVVFGAQGNGAPTITGCTGAGNVRGTTTGSIANMRAATAYDTPATNNPFSTWADTDEDGNTATVDYWDFVGPHDTPVLKAFGHSVSRQAYDYDIDDDGYIDIRTHAQWAALDEDRNGDGIPEDTASYLSPADYYAAYPGAMNTMGCQATDHDSNPTTPDQPTCKGYELLNDIDWQEGWTYETIPTLPAQPTGGRPTTNIDIRGNGYRLVNLEYNGNRDGSRGGSGVFGSVDGRIEGLGLWNPQVIGDAAIGGTLAGAIGWGGHVIGNYVYGDPGLSVVGGDHQWGGIVGEVITGSGAGQTAVLENSFVRADVGRPGGGTAHDTAGLTGYIQQGGVCRNSFWVGTWRHGLGARYYVTGSATPPFTVTNCFGNNTKADGSANIYSGVNPYANHSHPYADIVSTDDYTGIFGGYNTDEDGDGELDDVWDFGDDTEAPILKAYGHDRKFPSTRTVSGTSTVNVCERTLAVANEIIRHLKDDTWRTTAPAITAVHPDIVALSQCTAETDTQNVSVNHLRDFVVTTADNPFRLDPDRTTPASDKLTELNRNDLAYLPNANHFNFSDNDLTTLPYYLFQGAKVLQLDLSNNAITSLPLDAFSGQTATEVESDSNPFNYHDTWIDLSGNRLTAAGIPYRLFDEMPYLTGLSLDSNAITEVNTRWFDYLVNLGRRDSTANTMPRIIGLHLGGNEVTRHYFWHKAFPADMRFNEVAYSGANAADDLRDAIEARIAAAKGARIGDLDDDSNLDLTTIENLRNGMITSGACPDNLISGPAGSLDINDMPLQCEQATRWTPPGTLGASARVSAPSTSSVGQHGHIVLSFSHDSPSSDEPPITAYQLRYRLLSDGQNAPWRQQWRIIPIDLSSFGTKSATITVLIPLNVYQFQMRALVDSAPTPAVTFTQGSWPEGTMGAAALQPSAESGRGSVRLIFTHQPATNEDPILRQALAITGYQIRYRPLPANPEAPWTQEWRDIDVDISTPGLKSLIVSPLLESTRYQFQIRPISGGPIETVTLTQGTRIAIPEINSLKPTIREISVQAGQQILLAVDVYDAQDVMDNDLADDSDSQMIFRWTESPSGGGTFATPSSDRRVVYTAPDLPGTYTILAEAQPDGICRDHHNAKLGISDEDRARCIATITVRVSRAPGAVEPEADPVNPAGLIPTSLTDNAGIAYAVFTPVDGGTFSGEGITVTAPAGAIPDQQLLGIAAARSDIPVPQGIPGARLTIAAPYYEVNGVQRTGDAPVSAYNLDDPIRACMPIPAMFRADISDVAVISRSAADGSITILTSSIRQTATGLAACGNIGQLPATVAVANIGIIQATPEPPAPEEDLPDTGATAPSIWMLATIMLAALAVLFATGIVRTHRNPSARRRAGTVPDHDT